MSGINCYFMGAGIDRSPTLDKYKPYFIDHSNDKCAAAPGDASFAFEDGGQLVCELYVLSNGNGGLSLRYTYSANRQNYYSVAIPESMKIIIDAGDDQYAPAGSFVAPAVAWMAIEDFFDDPIVRSERLTWMDANEIDWPE